MKNVIKQNAFDYLIYILILTLFFSKALPNILLVLLSVLYLKDLNLKDYKKTFSAGIILFILLLYLFIKSLFYGTIVYDLKFYKGMLLLFWFSLILHKITDIEKFKLFILLGINACIISSLFLIGMFFYKNHTLPFANTAEVNNLLLLERPYIGFVAVLGFLLSVEKAVLVIKQKWIYILNAIVLLLFIILISARISIITIFCIAVVYFLFYYKVQWYKKILFTASIIVLFGIIVVTNKNISERFFIKNNIEESLKVASDYEPRIVIWNCANDMTLKKDFLLLSGFSGYETITNNFLDCYATTIENQSKKEYFLSEKFNSHNQFIDFYLIGGILGLVLFISFFIKLFYEAKSNFFSIAIAISFLLFFFVENIFYRQFGCYLFAIFILNLVPQNKGSNE
ncbi:O-antigen ligase [Flavobacterium sp. CLA17]|uniref:O-antigen ligase family protein n=1 Tax=Flavobacterium sp. CLA17 TaxID=2724135 RepID=UPI001490B682|nr:O-antigen ligase family protein [Flavobacterium sp. CLA17]QSB27323.1 O-antigen ligase family protein [Flavobacterium sp. CLA17]